MPDETLKGALAFDATMASDARAAQSSVSPVSRGEQIGRYVVLSQVGAGAMGMVFAAYDPELDRKVALKLLKHHGEDRDADQAKLRREAQALARLDHPNVVAVHDVGVHQGQLFVGMEFVEGQTLGEWMVDTQRRRPWPEVLRVFMEAGRGLAAAHQVGLVHRDFKPDNVMLGDDGRVRVMDFGLARGEGPADPGPVEVGEQGSSLEQQTGKQVLASRLTQTGTIMGTPAYMSLEQFEGGRVDARSDQFGFCVSLHEALYGQRPFAGKTVAQLVAAVHDGAVQPAPKGTAVPRWLREVVVRGLAVRPEERWPSMDALLAALADDPAVRRRKWGWTVALAALLGGAAWAGVAAVRADARTCEGMEEHLVGVWDAGRRAEVEATFEGTGLSYAPGTWTRVEERLDAYTQEWAAAREQACEATHRGEQSGELLDLRMACLDKRLVDLRATVDVLAQADETVVKKAVQAVAGLPRLERCADVDALNARVPPPEDPEVARQVATRDQRLAQIRALEGAGKYAEALEQANAVVADAAELGYEPLQARAWLRQGELQQRTGDYEAAEATLEQAYASAVGLGMREEAAAVSRSLVFVVGHRLARFDDARRWAQHAEPLARVVGTDETWVAFLDTRGAVTWKEGQYEDARDYFERALAIQEQTSGANHPSVGGLYNNLGAVAWNEGKYGDARGHFERALAIQEKVLGPDHPSVAISLNNLGNVVSSDGEYEDARDFLERALTIREQALGVDHPALAMTLMNLGTVAGREGKHADARGYFERALAIREQALGPDHPDLAMILDNLGLAASSEEKYETARGYHERALALQEKALGPDHRDLAYPSTGLGEALLGLARPAEALPHLERALALRTTHEGDPTDLAETRFALARALWDAPVELGRDRSRALTLAGQAQSAYEAAGAKSADALERVQAWRVTHHP